MIAKQDKYVAAIYCRLSSDDGQPGESGSIQTQKTLLTRFCKENHFSIYDSYCDDGWSGTNFDRPEFQRMISDIDAGKVNLVVVKDLSRFGREYAQMGLYIEHKFEENDIRFIAIGENIDTINGTDNIMLPFTNVINSYYAREASRKTKAAHRARAKDGKYLSGHALFGYCKDPADRHHLIIDPPAADVVRMIFQMFAEGIGYIKLTKILRDQSILNPQAYFNQNNPEYYKNSDYWRKPFDWHATSIRAILNNETYLGKTVFGKTKTKGFYQGKRIAAPEDEWIVVGGTHEPIVSQETWDLVHKLMESRRRVCRNGEIQMFSGLVKCADCGSSLNASYDGKKQKYKNFSCWVYKNYGNQRCTSHAIGWKALNTIVLDDIRRNAKASSLLRDDYIAQLAAMRTEKQKKDTEKYQREIKAADKRIADLDKIIAKLYEDSALGRLSEDRFNSMVNVYEDEQRALKTKRAELEQIVSLTVEAFGNAKMFSDLVRKYTDIQELDTQILNSLIDRIVVHEKTLDLDGNKVQRVDIFYKFIGFINHF